MMPKDAPVPNAPEARRKLDEKGRCCGRKPIEYRGKHTTAEGPHRYCPRCDRAYELDAPFQMNNWAWKKAASGKFERQTNKLPDSISEMTCSSNCASRTGGKCDCEDR